jgi:hypothetical protein
MKNEVAWKTGNYVSYIFCTIIYNQGLIYEHYVPSNPSIDFLHTDFLVLTNLAVFEVLQIKGLADSKVFKGYKH